MPAADSRTDPSEPSRPLHGVRVVDLTTVLFGPYASQFLGDYGADVIKVETPEGDSTRRTGEALRPGMASGFVSVNRNKRSIVLDLKRSAGREALMKIVEGADVLMHNIRPQKLAALGLDAGTVRARCPHLVYASLNGFSEAGPYAGRPAYDDIIQGMCGLSDLVRRRTGEADFLPTTVADKVCALIAVHAILAALAGRQHSGRGSAVEVSMFEAMTGFTLLEHLCGATFVPARGATGYARALAPSRRPYRTRDGYLCLMPYTDAHWSRFLTEVGRADLAADPRFAGMHARTRNIEVLYALTAGFVAERTTQQWVETCTRLDLPYGRVNTLDELLTDPHLEAVGFFGELPAGDGESSMRLMGTGVRFDGRPMPVRPPPALGEHTRELLREAGLDEHAIDALIEAGAAREAAPARPDRD